MSKNSEAVKRWRKNTKDRMVIAMGGCCQICGYNKTHKALEFHHINQMKKKWVLETLEQIMLNGVS